MPFTYSNEFKDIVRIIGRGKKLQRDLTFEEAETAMRLILNGQASEAQIGAFLISMRVKDETTDELRGFLSAAHSLMRPFPKPAVDQLIDLGLTYDGKADTLQVGVGAALVMSAAGIPVLLHGADDIPTKRGVAALNLLRTLGVATDLPPDRVSQHIEAHCFGVIDIAQLLPQWVALTPIRNQFGLRTGMNTVEKLFNPAHAPIHISGVYHKTYLDRLALLLPDNAWLIQGEEGSLDMKHGRKTLAHRIEGGIAHEIAIDAPALGFPPVDLAPISPDPAVHAQIILRALRDHTGEGLDPIILTAGVLISLSGHTPDLPSAIALSRETILSGKAYAHLTKFAHTP